NVTEPQAERSSSFEDVYGLKDGEVVKIVSPPFVAQRLEMAWQSNAAMMRYNPNGPSAMFFSWKGSQPQVRGAIWGGGRWGLQALVTRVMRLSAHECEGALWSKVKASDVNGDIVIREDTTQEERVRAVEKL